MRCILVFDHLNDVIYIKYNKVFARHINQFAKLQKLISEECISENITTNVIVQIFAPIVTSQRIIGCQFGNSYTSMQCWDDLNVVFEEYMGYLFLHIAVDNLSDMKRYLLVCINFVQYLCGPDVLQLKSNLNLSELLTNLLDNFAWLLNNDRSMFLEAIEQIVVNNELRTTVLQTLKGCVDNMLEHCTRVHAMILVDNKLLGLYSSQQTKDLSAVDILFATIVASLRDVNDRIIKEKAMSTIVTTGSSDDSKTESAQQILMHNTDISANMTIREEVEFFSPCTGMQNDSFSFGQSVQLINNPSIVDSYQVLFHGNEFIPKCIPHVIHTRPLLSDDEGVDVRLVLILEAGDWQTATYLYDAFRLIHLLQSVQIGAPSTSRSEVRNDPLRSVVDSLDRAIKKLCDCLRRVKNNIVECYYKQLTKKWDHMRKHYFEFFRTKHSEAIYHAETMTPKLLETLKDILSLTAFDKTLLKSTKTKAIEISKNVEKKLSSYIEFFRIKASNNFTLTSYLEECPGLVHFMYIDRSRHRILAPSIEYIPKQQFERKGQDNSKLMIDKEKIQDMVNFARIHLVEGRLSIMWKDSTFAYAYFIWFEDSLGAPLKPAVSPAHIQRALPQQVGILATGDFYLRLKELCFPKQLVTSVRCYEIYTIHLGLTTCSAILQHVRRLAVNIYDQFGTDAALGSAGGCFPLNRMEHPVVDLF